MRIGNGLVFAPFSISLFTSKKKFKKELKRIKAPKGLVFIVDGGDATTHFIGSHCIVCIKKYKKTKWSKSQIHCLLVHEAVHLWQEVRSHIGEDNPSAEFEAYSIQQLSQNLIDAYEGSLNDN